MRRRKLNTSKLISLIIAEVIPEIVIITSVMMVMAGGKKIGREPPVTMLQSAILEEIPAVEMAVEVQKNISGILISTELRRERIQNQTQPKKTLMWPQKLISKIRRTKLT